MNKTTKSLFSTAVITLMIIGMTSVTMGKSDEDSDDTTVDVTVVSKVAVDVTPNSLSYPEASVASQEDKSYGNYTAVEIENIGSEYIDRVWLNATVPDSEPFGTGDPSNYDAANFLQVKPDNTTGKLLGDSDDYLYVNRKEFHKDALSSDEVPSYIDVDGQFDGKNPSKVYVGRFRMGNVSYYYAIPTDSEDTCQGANGIDIIRVGRTPHTHDQVGTHVFHDGGDDYDEYNINELDSSSTYGIAGSGPDDGENGVTLRKLSGANEVNRTYDVLTACDDSSNPHTIRSRYNVDPGDTDDLSSNGVATQFLLDAGTTAKDMLLPGESFSLHTGIEVPRGVAQGDMQQGTMKVLVTANESAQSE